jgi:Fur family transcriptional regulator, ferric uptake regulator
MTMSMSMTTISDDPRVDAIIEKLRGAGGRVTTARRLVVAALVQGRAHPTADDVAAFVQAQHPEIALSTIYRTLDALEGLGLVEHTHLGHGSAVYHLGAPHQHLVCEQCGAVIDVPAALLDDLRAQLRMQYAFEVHVGHFAMLGRCGKCGAVAVRT